MGGACWALVHFLLPVNFNFSAYSGLGPQERCRCSVGLGPAMAFLVFGRHYVVEIGFNRGIHMCYHVLSRTAPSRSSGQSNCTAEDNEVIRVNVGLSLAPFR